MNDKFHLRVVSREGPVFEGDVTSVTSFNEKGKFDVLAQHANFISLITQKLSIIDKEGIEKVIPFDNALLRVRGNNAEVYIGIEGLGPSVLLPSENL